MAVINLSHRQAILSKAQSGGDQELDFGDDFDAVLGDLTSAIADLEAISVVSDVYTFIYIYICYVCSHSLLCNYYYLCSLSPELILYPQTHS